MYFKDVPFRMNDRVKFLKRLAIIAELNVKNKKWLLCCTYNEYRKHITT